MPSTLPVGLGNGRCPGRAASAPSVDSDLAVVFQGPGCKIFGRATAASGRQMLKYPASSAARSQGLSLLELSHMVTRSIRLADQLLTGADRSFPCWNVLHRFILAGIRCVDSSSATSNNASHWLADVFDPCNHVPRYAAAWAPFRHVCWSYVQVRSSTCFLSNWHCGATSP